MTDVLIIADSIRSPDMRHAVPVAIGDPFLYAERDGRAAVVVASFERERVEALAMGLDVRTVEDAGVRRAAHAGALEGGESGGSCG